MEIVKDCWKYPANYLQAENLWKMENHTGYEILFNDNYGAYIDDSEKESRKNDEN